MNFEISNMPGTNSSLRRVWFVTSQWTGAFNAVACYAFWKPFLLLCLCIVCFCVDSTCSVYLLLCTLSLAVHLTWHGTRFVQCPGASFELHTAETHNVLAYLCYFLHLKSKQNEESTPQEKYMQSCIFPESGPESIRFFPNPSTKTMDLRNETRSDREDLLEAKMSTCLQDLSDVKQMVSSMGYENDGIRSTSSDNPPNRRRRSLNPMFSESLERTFDTIQ